MSKNTAVWFCLIFIAIADVVAYRVTGDGDFWVSSQIFIAASFIVSLMKEVK